MTEKPSSDSQELHKNLQQSHFSLGNFPSIKPVKTLISC